MSFDRYEDYEAVAMVGFIAAFLVAEKLKPFRRGGWRDQLALDIAGAIVLAVGVNLSRLGLGALFDAVDLRSALGGLDAVRGLPGAAKIAIAFVVADFGVYWVHRLMHAVGLLWRTHRWHHSARHLYWLSGFRASLLHTFAFAIPQVLAAFYLMQLSVVEAGIAFSIGVFAQLWQHANIDVNTRVLEWLFVTPRFHRLHHAVANTTAQNLGASLSIWDRMFGTFVDPDSVPGEFDIGLSDDPNAVRMMVGL